MKTLFAPTLAALAALAACAHFSPAVIHQDQGKALLGAEALFDAAVLSADIAAKDGAIAKAGALKLDALADQGQALARLARAAYAAGDAANVAARTAALAGLAAQINTLNTH